MNLRSPIFRKLFFSATLLIAATLTVLDFYLARYMARHQVENVEQRLEAQARLLTAEAATISRDQLASWARAVGARAQARVTLMDSHGVVLADSDHDSETMENHAGRPEVREALRAVHCRGS